MGKTWKHIVIITSISVFITLMGFLIFYPVPSPPAGEIDNARKSIALAARNNAATYSPSLFIEAENCYDSALKHWRIQNEKFFYSRNFEKVSQFALLAAQKAADASGDSQRYSSSLDSVIRQKIINVRLLDSLLNRRFSKYPLSNEMRKNISHGEMLISEAESDWNKGIFLDADRKISEAERLLSPIYQFAVTDMKSYFRSFPDWKRMVDTAIAESRTTRDYSIIIDKFSRRLIVYLNGEAQFEYFAELGRNWVGDKRVRGDKATPEGKYMITKKFESDSTKYHKALLLNYPNEEDTANFAEAVKKGTLPRSAKIGGMIEIHGNGGKGSDWTAGCIAVTDREMDSLFKIVKIGTPVTIVGSMYDLKQVLRR